MGLRDFFNSKKPIKVGSPLAPMGDFPLINASDVIVDYVDNEDGTKTEIRLDKKLETDTTFTKAGVAADAKAVGDLVGNIHDRLTKI